MLCLQHAGDDVGVDLGHLDGLPHLDEHVLQQVVVLLVEGDDPASRIDSEDGCTLIIVDTPAMEQDETGVVYSTLPMGIIVTSKQMSTSSSRSWSSS